MINFNQITRITYDPPFVTENSEDDLDKKCLIVIGKDQQTIFMMKFNGNDCEKFQSKKYLKKESKNKIIERLLLEMNEGKLNDIIEDIDLKNKGYLDVVESIDDKFFNLESIYKQM